MLNQSPAKTLVSLGGMRKLVSTCASAQSDPSLRSALSGLRFLHVDNEDSVRTGADVQADISLC